jgi:riboflavin synthase
LRDNAPMFTGIVTAVGTITSSTPLGEGQAFGRRLRVSTPVGYLDSVALGDSVGLNGACMTVVALDRAAPHFEVEVSVESLARTAGLGQPGPINLELALRAGDRLGGHLVAGHVDGVGRVTRLDRVGESCRLELLVPKDLARFVAIKGSIVVNGVSLTVNSVVDEPDGCRLQINLVPHTLQTTTLGSMERGATVNLEVDLVARYVERLMSAPSS